MRLSNVLHISIGLLGVTNAGPLADWDNDEALTQGANAGGNGKCTINNTARV